MRVAIGSDHAGYDYKKMLTSYLMDLGYDVFDAGTYSKESCDYPDIAVALSEKVTSGDCDRGILICGTGIGMGIAANKVKGIRAACASEHFSVKYSRLHNDANVLCIGARVIGEGTAAELCELFLKTDYEGGRHNKRVDILKKIENK